LSKFREIERATPEHPISVASSVFWQPGKRNPEASQAIFHFLCVPLEDII